MKVLLSGATGFIGGHLRPELEAAGHEVLTVGRGANSDFDWSDEGLKRGVGAVDGIVHLAGESLFARRWTASQKAVLKSSRTETTRRLADLATELDKDFLITASAVGYYGPSDAENLTEEAPQGDDFLAELCGEWERAADLARQSSVRVATIRIGVVIGTDGGALKRMLLPFRLGLGGPLGSGKQAFPWIHIDDLVRLFRYTIENKNTSGVYNGTSPNPVSMGKFAKTLGRVLHRPAIFPVPSFVLKLLLGEISTILLTGQRPIPKRAMEAGFELRYPHLEPALHELLDGK